MEKFKNKLQMVKDHSSDLLSDLFVNTSEKYNEVLEAISEYGLFPNSSTHFKQSSEAHLFQIHLQEEYGIFVDRIDYIHNIQIDDFRRIFYFGDFGESGNYISWSDDDNQPKNELMLVLTFPTGPYMLSGEYFKNIFDLFFDELKAFGPKYTDSHNHKLYFSIESASLINNEFNSILKKYREIAKVEYLKQKAKKLAEELAKLENAIQTDNS